MLRTSNSIEAQTSAGVSPGTALGLTCEMAVSLLGRQNGRPMIRTPCRGINTGQLGHGGSRACHGKGDDKRAVDDGDGAPLLQANNHGGSQADPTVTDVIPDTENVEWAYISFRLLLEAEVV